MSVRDLVLAAGGGGAKIGGWMATAGETARVTGGCVDANGNIYSIGYQSSTAWWNPWLVKYNAQGVLQWSKKIFFAKHVFPHRIGVDAAGNVYVSASISDGTASGYLLKFSPSGAKLGQLKFTGAVLLGISVGAAGDVYVCGYYSYVNPNDGGIYSAGFLARYNSSLIRQWQRGLSGPATVQYYGVRLGTDGYIYCTGWAYDGSVSGALIAKFDTYGNLQWQRLLKKSGVNQDYGSEISVSSSGVVVVGTFGGAVGTGFAAKYSLSGALQWQRELSSASWVNAYGVALDADEGVYLSARRYQGSHNVALFMRYTANGVLQWAREIDTTQTDDQGLAVSLTSAGFVAHISAGNMALTALLPITGAGAGSYSNPGLTMTYQSSPVTDAAATATSSNTSFSVASIAIAEEFEAGSQAEDHTVPHYTTEI